MVFGSRPCSPTPWSTPATTTGQRLFAVNLDDPGIEVCAPTWAGPGMIRADTRLREVPSGVGPMRSANPASI